MIAYLPAGFLVAALAIGLVAVAAGVTAGLRARRRRDRELDALFASWERKPYAKDAA